MLMRTKAGGKKGIIRMKYVQLPKSFSLHSGALDEEVKISFAVLNVFLFTGKPQRVLLKSPVGQYFLE